MEKTTEKEAGSVEDEVGRMKRLVLTVPANSRFVALARHVVAQAARRSELTEEHVDDIKLAFTEVVTNAMEATERAGSDAAIEVGIVLGDSLEVVVSDRGPGFPAASPPGPAQGAAGLGLMISRALVDSLEVEAREGGGSTVTMVLGRQPYVSERVSGS